MEGSNEIFLLTMESLLKNTQDFIFIKDADQNYMGCSKKFAKLVKLEDASEIIGKRDSDLFETELAERYRKEDEEVLKTGGAVENSTELVSYGDGEEILVSLSRYAVRDKKNQVIAVYGIGRDITAQIQVEEEREYRILSTMMFEDVLQADLTDNRMLKTEDSVWLRELNISGLNCYTDIISAISQDVIHPDYSYEFQRTYSRDKLLREYKNGIREFTHITFLRRDGQEYRWIECRTRLYLSELFGTVRMTIFLCDKDGEIRHHQELKRQAETDILTGLMSREGIARYIGECIAGNGRMQAHAMILVDLDGFKTVNDAIGHGAGDEVLIEMAKKLRELFRESDLVGRVGGDEFLIFMKNTVSNDDIIKKAKKIVNAVPQLKHLKKEEIPISCSVGISTYWNNGKDFKSLYEEADKAKRQAKEEGRNRIVFY